MFASVNSSNNSNLSLATLHPMIRQLQSKIISIIIIFFISLSILSYFVVNIDSEENEPIYSNVLTLDSGNRLFSLEDGLSLNQEKCVERKLDYLIDIEKIRVKYEENFFIRHDKHISLREKLKHRKEQLEEEHRRLSNAP